ncbi:hypothetical protein PV682_33345 [Streptomyces niveiscabiei]|uniref:hypothetical protein n=1 Tax=Streptomyces niveiscabiei TaxID=164115 RepID=UPI00299FAB0C|nr:hypothetical protein [Streptomyces niveiscabiei]MDX3386306.1 hypothetical protein [Streptomyces niveiscabiei]
MASLAARLESRDQIEHRAHPRHRHVQELHLTNTGRPALRAAEAEITAVEQRVTTALGPDGSARLRTLLDQVTDTVTGL